MAERVRMLPAGKLDQGAFVERFGGVVEHSPWVAEAAWSWRPFRSFDALYLAFDAALRAAPASAQLAVLQAHPDLATDGPAVTASLTAESRGEQAGAGLDQLTESSRLALARPPPGRPGQVRLPVHHLRARSRRRGNRRAGADARREFARGRAADGAR